MDLQALKNERKGSKSEYLMRLYRASQYYKATPDLENWVKVRAISSLPAPKCRSFSGSCAVGCGLFMHGGYGLIDGFRYGALNDWHLFDMGLGVWIKLHVEGPNNKPFEFRRHMHSMTAVAGHAAKNQLCNEALNSRIMWVRDLDHLMGKNRYDGEDSQSSS